MKKKTAKVYIITEKLPRPYAEEVPEFKLRDRAVPIFGEYGMEVVQQFCNLAHEMLLKEPLMVFWGLSGNLGCYYSTVTDETLTMETLHTKIMVAKPMQPFSVHRTSSFDLMVIKLGGMAILKPINFDEAMLVVSGKKLPPAPEYEEPEEDEFDDNCTVECTAGDHKCGKEKKK